MPVFVNGDRNLLFVHVPKAGGTSMERMLRASGWKMKFHASRNSEPRTFALRRCSPQHYHGALLSEVFDLSAFELRFAIVRDPIARFRSEYLHQVRRLPEGIRTDAGSVEAWAEQAFAAYAANPYVYDNHPRPQSEFLIEGLVVHRLEDGLEAATVDVERRLGHPIERDVPRGQHSVERAGVPSDAVEVSPKLEARLREFYAADFAAFGY
jgi:hypothetical protein